MIPNTQATGPGGIMSQQTVNSDITTTDPLLARIHTHINEEKVLKDLSAVQLNKLKALDELLAEIEQSAHKDELKKTLEENLFEYHESLISRYLLAGLTFNEKSKEGIIHYRSLIDDFQKHAKWNHVDHLCDKILSVDENSKIALRAKVESTERLKGKKELKPILEKLAGIDKDNPDIIRKYASSIAEDDKEKSLSYFKKAAEGYARKRDYKNLEELWNKIVNEDYKDMSFFERIERILISDREKMRMAALLQTLMRPHLERESDIHWESVIIILKKILEYEPNSSRARTDLIRAYKEKHKDHSLLNEFIKLADLTNNRKPVAASIASFEKNIVFDKDKFVYHRTRGVGKITSIDKDQVIIDFQKEPGQKMSLQMAISSLQPLDAHHIWVHYYENQDDLLAEFNFEDKSLFLERLIKSFGGHMTLADIKQEVCNKLHFADTTTWSSWWQKARGDIKKSAKITTNPKKKDEFILRTDGAVISDEEAERFRNTNEWPKKLEIACRILKEGSTPDCIKFYSSQEESKDALKRLHSILFLDEAAHRYSDDDELGLKNNKEYRKKLEDLITKLSKEHIIKYYIETPIDDYRSKIISLINESRSDAEDIFIELLLSPLVKDTTRENIVSSLPPGKASGILKRFVDKVVSQYRTNSEAFVWLAKNVLKEKLSGEWPALAKKEIILILFRLLKPLSQVEKKGTKIKNDVLTLLFGVTTGITVEAIKTKGKFINEIINDPDTDINSIRKMVALFREVSSMPEAFKDNFLSYVRELRNDFVIDKEEHEEEEAEEESFFPPDHIILVSENGLKKLKEYYDHLINVDMPANSRDIGEAQERGDLRENAEYKAALERQSQLQAEAKRLNSELKKAREIDPITIRTDVVTIGTKVKVKNDAGEKIEYTILGPWDADADAGIISYLSPLGKSLIGKKVGEKATVEGKLNFAVLEINHGM